MRLKEVRPKDLPMDAGVKLERLDIRVKRFQEVRAHAGLFVLVKGGSLGEVLERRELSSSALLACRPNRFGSAYAALVCVKFD